MNDLKPISIETAVAKLVTAENLSDPGFASAIETEPRLPELLLFLQWHSAQPGGLPKAIAQITRDFTPQFGPPCLHQESPLSIAQKEEVWAILPTARKDILIHSKTWRDKSSRVSPDWESYIYPLPQSPAEKQKFQSLLSKISDGEMRSIVIEAAMDNLPDLIRDLFCESNPWRNPSPWYCPDLLSVLIDAMELHARRVEQQWAHTEIFKIIFDRIDYSVTEKRLVKIVGQARTGKTEACEAFAKAYPGRVRLVSTPPGNSKRDLFMAIGEAFGIPLTAVNALARIGETVQYIVRHGRLGIIFDEAQFLLPSPGSHVHTPARLDWIRCNVIDRKLPCVLVCTPQTFNHFVRDLRDKRGYNFDQVLGRIDLNVNLPDTLEKDDLAEILRTHGAGIPQKLQPFLLSAVLINGKKDSLVKAFEAVCCRARHLARRDGSRAISQADLETAVSEVIPAGAAPAATVPTRSGRTRQTVSGRLTNSPAPEMRPEREITPVSGAAPAREIRPLTNQPA